VRLGECRGHKAARRRTEGPNWALHHRSPTGTYGCPRACGRGVAREGEASRADAGSRPNHLRRAP
jgi:hypothetical protein